ncbi:MAG: exodeoxyribonuclease V subunit beta [Desulfamplus sp.]|nr:exodeoxyribonuclease V subunit beta [Desulfamplus sp.]
MKKFDITSAPLKGRAVIEASAGTGKTYAIAGLFLRLVVEANLKVNQILVVTFTKAATEELRDRIRRRVREGLNALTRGYTGNDPVLLWLVEKYNNNKNGANIAINRLKEALVCFDESAIFTIHGFCQKMLSENAFESNSLFDTELVADSNDLLIQVCRDYYRKHFLTMDPFLFSNPKIKDINPDYLLKLIKTLSVDPDFHIIPDNLPYDSYNKDALASAAKELKNLYSYIQNEWIKEGKNIGEILINAQDNKAFNGKYIKTGSYEKTCSETDNYIYNGDCWNIELDSSKKRYIEKITNRFMQEKAKDINKLPIHNFFNDIEKFIDLLDKVDNMISLFCLELKLDFLKSAGTALNKIKMTRNVRAFDDLLLSMHKAVGNGESVMAEAVRKRFSAALIDEFQDTDPLQYAIFTNIFKNIYSIKDLYSTKEEKIQEDQKKGGKFNNILLYLIGDPKQAIYGFRGADIYAYLKAKDNVGSFYTLGTNWRSDGGLVTAVNNLFDMKGRNPFLIDGIGYIPVNHAPDRIDGSMYVDNKPFLPMNIVFIDKSLCKSKKKEEFFITKNDAENFSTKFTASKISELVNLGAKGRAVIIENDKISLLSQNQGKSVEPQDIAVLVRTNRQGFLILEELRKLEIPGVIYGAGSVYDEIEAVEIERFMRAVAEPSNERQLKTALITPLFGFDGNKILELTSNENLYDSIQSEFLDYNTIWKKSGFISMFRYMLVKREVKANLLAYTGGERKLTNYLHISELLHIADVKLKPGIDGLINFLAKKRLSNGSQSQSTNDKSDSDEYKIRLETDEKAVKIITIHKSKGLEFPIVFSPYLYDVRGAGDDDFVRFHDEEKRQTLDIGSQYFEQNKNIMIEENFAESIRLAYVALTRAKYACFTIWGKISSSEHSALSWIFHGDKVASKGSSMISSTENLALLTWEEIKSDVDKIAQSSNKTIGIEVVGDITYEPYLPAKKREADLTYRNFQQGKGFVPYGWKISSFTSIIAGRDSQMPDHDEIEDSSSLIERLREEPFKAEPLKEKIALSESSLEGLSESNSQELLKSQPQELSESSFFHFPKGARAGSCIHEIMENIDFTKPNIQVVKEKIEKFGFKESEIQKVEDMLTRVLSSDLMPDREIFLKNIKNEHRINEMEFFLPISNANSTAIASIMEKYGSGATADFGSTMKSLGFSQKNGYLKGFIDMIFFYNGKYYLLDWKTNHLGNSFDDYSLPLLSVEMIKSGYVLQYLLYTVALNAYLKNRIIDYGYDNHFGGVFYLFMRGIKPNSETGIYLDRPDKALVDELTMAITGINYCYTEVNRKWQKED